MDWSTYRFVPREHLPAVKAPPREMPDAVAFARERLGFEPDELQAEALGSTANRGILLCSRQWGKSTVVAAKAIHRAFTRDGALVVVASPSERQSGEFLLKVEQMAARLGIPARGDGHNTLSLAMPNGSRVVGLPGTEDTVRGFSAVSMLLIDEAARVPDKIYKALRPMLAVGQGDLWLMSTPCGKQGFFYETWEHGGAHWKRVRATGVECSRISAEFLEEERASLGPMWFRQEYLCEFVDSGGAMFDRDVVEGALDSGISPVEGF